MNGGPVTLSPDDRTLYVASTGARAVSVFDTGQRSAGG
jgi:sugar lactone lactonase YvrE